MSKQPDPNVGCVVILAGPNMDDLHPVTASRLPAVVKALALAISDQPVEKPSRPSRSSCDWDGEPRLRLIK